MRAVANQLPTPGVRIALLVLVAAAGAIFVPLWAPLVLAAWVSDLIAPLGRRLRRALGGRRAAAGVLAVVVVLAIGAPAAAIAVTFVLRLRELATLAIGSGSARGALQDLLGTAQSAEPTPSAPRAWLQLAREHGAAAWRVVSHLWSASMSVVVGVVVFVVALYALEVDGSRLYAGLARNLPVAPTIRRRLVRAFLETGRGLIVGAGGTALVQGLLATVAYLVLDVPNAVTLGALTGAASIVPAVGTALVWAPLSVALALAGHPVRAAVLAVLGFAVIGTVDNLLRPWLARVGHLRLPTWLIFVSMLGGLDLFGAWGIVLGPLLVRMGIEALQISARGPPEAARCRGWDR